MERFHKRALTVLGIGILVCLVAMAALAGVTKRTKGHTIHDKFSTQSLHLVKGTGPAAITTSKGAHLAAFFDTRITAAELLALNATPITVVAAPGTGQALLFDHAIIDYDFVSAACTGVAAGEDLVFKYTGSAGEEVSSHVETTGMIDQANDELRAVNGVGGDGAVSDTTPVANAVLVLHLLVGEVATCDSPLDVRVYYSVIPTDIPN